jgi:hypothetical protein
MNKQKILEAAQKHGDWAFCQGYEAALQGILKEDKLTLSQMPEAFMRSIEYQKLWDALKSEANNDNI